MRRRRRRLFERRAELVVEIARSSRRYDLGKKKLEYERTGIQEYLVVELEPDRIHWFIRRGERFEELSPGLMKTGRNFNVLVLLVVAEFVALSDRMSSLTPWNGSIAWMRQLRKRLRRSILPHTAFRLGSSVGVAIVGNRNTWI